MIFGQTRRADELRPLKKYVSSFENNHPKISVEIYGSECSPSRDTYKAFYTSCDTEEMKSSKYLSTIESLDDVRSFIESVHLNGTELNKKTFFIET